MTRESFVNNELHGPASFYDSSGQLSNVNNFYHDVPYGSSLKYRLGKLSSYSYQDFNGKLIFHLDYSGTEDSVEMSRTAYFYLYRDGSTGVTDDGKWVDMFSFRIALINPPQCKYDYDLVSLDSAGGAVTRVLDSLISDEPFAHFRLKKPFVSNVNPAIRLTGLTLDGRRFAAFKRIKDPEEELNSK